jgi:hypothetical protein
VQPTTTRRLQIGNAPIQPTSFYENDTSCQTLLFERSYAQQTIKGIPPIIKKWWNELHMISKKIQEHLMVYINNCANPEFHMNNLPFFEFSSSSSIGIQLQLVIKIITTYFCGSYAKFLSKETEFLQQIIIKSETNRQDALNLFHIINSIVEKTMPIAIDPRM